MQEKPKQVPEKRKNLQKDACLYRKLPHKSCQRKSPLAEIVFFDGRLFSPDCFHLLAIVKALWPKYTAKTINPNPSPNGTRFGFVSTVEENKKISPAYWLD